jgi:hypothetical protein
MDPIGKSPIPVPALILGKVAMVSCWLFFILKMLGIDAMLYDSAITHVLWRFPHVCRILSVLHSPGELSSLCHYAWRSSPHRDEGRAVLGEKVRATVVGVQGTSASIYWLDQVSQHCAI